MESSGESTPCPTSATTPESARRLAEFPSGQVWTRSIAFVPENPVSRFFTPLPRAPSPNGARVQLRSGLRKLPRLPRAWTRLRSRPGGKRAHTRLENAARFPQSLGRGSSKFSLGSRAHKLRQAPSQGYISDV